MPNLKLPPIVSLLAILLVAAPAGQTTTPPDPVRTFLTGQMGFTPADLSALDAGRAVARQMKVREAVDVNIFGAVRIDAPAEAFVEHLRNIDAFERKLGIIQVGKLGGRPEPGDFSGLTLEPSDVADLQECRPMSCDVQLPASVITRFRTELAQPGANATDTANRVFRSFLAERLQLYRSGGLALLGAYQDQSKPIWPATEFRVLTSPGDLPADIPELTHYLRAYPHATLPGSTDVVYWNKGAFGLKPTVRLNHLVIYPMPPNAPHRMRYVVATSQLYANHYFSSTLELRSLIDDPAQPGKQFYLFYTTKSRVSGLTGVLGMLIRPKVRSRARAGMEKYLAVTKRVVEGSNK